MLYEDDVVDAVCTTIRRSGYEIVQRLRTKQKGDDIIAVRTRDGDVVKLIIEAKGETSSNENSNRYGKAFDSSQVRDHVASAVYRAIQILCRPTDDDGQEVLAGLAFPKTMLHQTAVDSVLPVLRRLGIMVFWVDGDHSVEVDGGDQF